MTQRIIGGVITAMLIAAPAAQADTLSIGLEAWWQDPDGWVENDDSDRLDLDDDLLLDDDHGLGVWVDFKVPLPLIPNLRLSYLSTDFSGSGTAERSFVFEDTPFIEGLPVDADVELDQYDAILYWTPVGGDRTGLDLGVDLKWVDGRVTVRSGELSERYDFDAPLPLAYARFSLDMPGTGFGASLQASGIAYDGDRFVDLRAAVNYHTALGLNLHGGWRHQQLELDDWDDVSADLEFSGPFAGLSWGF